MNRSVPLCLAAAAIAAAILPSVPGEVRAQQGAAQALDDCLVGIWKQDGNGAAEWMRRNVPGMTISWGGFGGLLDLKADGSYTAGGGGTATATGGPMADASRMQAEIEGRTTGRWSAAGGTLTLSPVAESASGQMQVTVPGGSPQAMQMPMGGAMGPMQYEYTCSGATFETRMRFPGMADPMVQRYMRATP